MQGRSNRSIEKSVDALFGKYCVSQIPWSISNRPY